MRNPPFSFRTGTRGIRRRVAHGVVVPPDGVRSNCGSERSASLRGCWLALTVLMPTLGGRLIESIRFGIPICGNAVEPTTSVLTRPRVERFGFFMCFIHLTDYRLQNAQQAWIRRWNPRRSAGPSILAAPTAAQRLEDGDLVLNQGSVG